MHLSQSHVKPATGLCPPQFMPYCYLHVLLYYILPGRVTFYGGIVTLTNRERKV